MDSTHTAIAKLWLEWFWQSNANIPLSTSTESHLCVEGKGSLNTDIGEPKQILKLFILRRLCAEPRIGHGFLLWPTGKWQNLSGLFLFNNFLLKIILNLLNYSTRGIFNWFKKSNCLFLLMIEAVARWMYEVTHLKISPYIYALDHNLNLFKGFQLSILIRWKYVSNNSAIMLIGMYSRVGKSCPTLRWQLWYR